MQYTRQLALVLVPVYFIKHSVSCYIYYTQTTLFTSEARMDPPIQELNLLSIELELCTSFTRYVCGNHSVT